MSQGIGVAPTREAGVMRETARLNEVLARLEAVVSQLGSRLETAMLLEVPTAGQGKMPEKDRESCPIAVIMVGVRNQIESQTFRIENYLGRLDI